MLLKLLRATIIDPCRMRDREEVYDTNQGQSEQIPHMYLGGVSAVFPAAQPVVNGVLL